MKAAIFIEKREKYGMGLAMIVFTILTSGAIVGQNFITVFGLNNISTSMFITPIAFILVAAITELYGFRYARSVIWMFSVCSLFMAFLLFIFTKIPASNAYIGDVNVFHKFCIRLAIIVTSSAVISLISEHVNAWSISKLRMFTRGRFLLLRAFLSISFAVAIDTGLFFPFFILRQHYNITASFEEICLHISVKILFEVMLLPVFWLIVECIKLKEGEAEFDTLPECGIFYSSARLLQPGVTIGGK